MPCHCELSEAISILSLKESDVMIKLKDVISLLTSAFLFINNIKKVTCLFITMNIDEDKRLNLDKGRDG